MFRKIKRTAALALAASMLMAQLAYADQVITAEQPGSVSSNGPSAEKVLNENGVLEIGFHGGTAGFVNAGPGVAGNIEGTGTGNGGGQTGTVQNPTLIDGTVQSGTSQNSGTGTAQGTGGSQVNVNQNIAKPVIASEAAILYDATTNQVLFEQNADKAMYPASMTKLMTALLAVEHLQLSDTVSFSATATQNLEAGAVTVNLTTGDTLSVKDSLYALLLKSACEVANGLAEKISGSQAAFAALMNQRAQQLGCTNTHFENASGLNGASHYTTARDMALITKAALSNETIRSILQTKSYQLPASKKRGAITIQNGNKMIDPTASQYYAGTIGGKTGYTSKAGNTFAVGVSKNGHELIAVVLKSKQKHYEDAKALLDYGYKLIGGNGSSAPDNGQQQAAGKWEKQGSNWLYKKADGSYCKNEWLDLAGATYFFGSDSLMCTGWKQFTNGAWYFFNPENGAMVKSSWVVQDGKYYYLQADGTMATNKVIDNTYRVDDKGVYVEKVG